ncbi:MAG TPA: AbrB/MazE/SpoVT family DNA-binding domain-containing protein [Streptosporangiaceae bacterium]|nr:AbrB/MazE/SpoVT family DNA-binding domain-containing protein [Streptosporangiaceae bacterium]
MGVVIVVRITAKGQVTIPVAIREQAGLLPETEVDVVYVDGVVQIVKAETHSGTSRGERLVRRMWGSGGYSGMTTDEIMALTRGWGEDDRGDK